METKINKETIDKIAKRVKLEYSIPNMIELHTDSFLQYVVTEEWSDMDQNKKQDRVHSFRCIQKLLFDCQSI